MGEQENKDFIERFTVRMPTGMREEIAKLADQNGRSMNSEIVKILQDALDGREGNLDGEDPDEKLFEKLNKMAITLSKLEVMIANEKEATEAGLVIAKGEKK